VGSGGAGGIVASLGSVGVAAMGPEGRGVGTAQAERSSSNGAISTENLRWRD